MRRLIGPFLAILTFSTGLAQDAKKPQEPEYANAFFFLEKDGNLKPLERQAAKVATKVKLGGADSNYVLPNAHSAVRFPANGNLQFVVQPDPKNADPTTIFQLYVLKVSKGQREVQVAKVRSFGGAKNTLGDTAIPFDVSKYGENSVLLKPHASLSPGEYMWAANSTLMVPQGYCFGIDPATP